MSKEEIRYEDGLLYCNQYGIVQEANVDEHFHKHHELSLLGFRDNSIKISVYECTYKDKKLEENKGASMYLSKEEVKELIEDLQDCLNDLYGISFKTSKYEESL